MVGINYGGTSGKEGIEHNNNVFGYWAVQIENKGVSNSPILSLSVRLSLSFSGRSFRPLSQGSFMRGHGGPPLSLFLRWNRWWWCLWWWSFITPALARLSEEEWVCVRGKNRRGAGRVMVRRGWGVEGRTTGGKGDGVGRLPLEVRVAPRTVPRRPSCPPSSYLLNPRPSSLHTCRARPRACKKKPADL